MSVKYFNQEISFNFKNKRIVSKWIIDTIEEEEYALSNLNIIFTSDIGLLDINKEFLSHDYYTDIITFDYTEDDLINGELYISIERVLENSSGLEVQFIHELHRVIIHGVLHLCGYKDKNSEDEREMRQKEDFYLNKLDLK